MLKKNTRYQSLKVDKMHYFINLLTINEFKPGKNIKQ